MKVPRNAIARAVETVLETGCRKATVYLGSRMVVKCTARHKPDKRETAPSFVITMGAPNFAECRFIRLCFKAGKNLPKGAQIKWWAKEKK